jgi:hypothetical protein
VKTISFRQSATLDLNNATDITEQHLSYANRDEAIKMGTRYRYGAPSVKQLTTAPAYYVRDNGRGSRFLQTGPVGYYTADLDLYTYAGKNAVADVNVGAPHEGSSASALK